MTMTRRDKLQSMLDENPGDTFLRYALALELDKLGETEHSLSIHHELMNEDPPYVPAFFMAGQTLHRLERIDEARQILKLGVQQAKMQQNEHAAREMSDWLEMLDE